MSVRPAARRSTIEVVWPNPPGGAPHATLLRERRGERIARGVGARARLDVDEAAAVLRRSRGDVAQAIRAGFLPSCRARGGAGA